MQDHYILSLFVNKCIYIYIHTQRVQWVAERKAGYLDKLYTGGGVPVETILEQSLSNHERKRTAGVVKRKKAGVEKSRNRTHCGIGEE